MRHGRRHLLVAAMATLMACVGPIASASADRAPALRYQTHTRGDLASAGNTLLTCPVAVVTCGPARAGTGGSRQNNNFNMEYVDVDADAATFNSSSATLNLPAGATVTFAGLYWGADTSAGSGGAAAPAAAFASMALLDAPGAGGYEQVTGSQYDEASASWPGRYQEFADVTEQVAAAGAGDYTLANVQAGTGVDRYGGWTLVVAYRLDGDPIRNLSVFDGLVTIENTASTDLTIDGFETPGAGVANATLGLVTYEGDYGITGDSLSLNGTTVSDALNAPTNFFNSSVSDRGTRVSAKSPDYVDQLGFDSDRVAVDGLIAAGATSAGLHLTTNGDTYFVGAVTVSTDQVPEPPAIAAAPNVTGTTEDGQVLTATTGSWSGTDPMDFEYQWQRCDTAGSNCVDIPGANGSTYELTADDVGSTVRVVVTATNEFGTDTAASAVTGTVVQQAPSSTAAPTVTGTAADDAVLTAGDGGWDGTGPFDFDYQWQRCDQTGASCSDIPGADGSTYELTDDDVGSTVRVVVTATNDAGSDPQASDATDVVAATAPSSTTPPGLTGTATDGEVLTAGDGDWDGTGPFDFDYQWQRCDAAGNNCTDIPGATGPTYELSDDDAGHTVVVIVTATNDEGSQPATSAPSGVVAAVAPQSTADPAVNGTPADEQTLTADEGDWTGTGPFDFDYQWQRCDAAGNNCTDIPGATGPTYQLGDDDAGHTVVVVVTATNPEGSQTVSSDPSGVVAAVAPANTAAPAVSGPGQVGGTLTAGDGTWTGTGPFDVDYQWQRCDAAGNNCVDIPAADDETYELTEDDIGHTIVVVIVVTNPQGSDTVTSAPSAPIVDEPDTGDTPGGDDQSGAPVLAPSPTTDPAAGLALLPGSTIAPDSCRQVTGTQVLAFQVSGAGRFRIRVAPGGLITAARPLRAAAPLASGSGWRLTRYVRRVVYRLGGRRIAVRRRAPWAVRIGPSLLRRADRQTLTVRVVPKKGKTRVARVQLNSRPCSQLFTVVHRPSPKASLLGLRVDSVSSLRRIVFRVPAGLLAKRGSRGVAGKLRVRLAGRRAMNFPLAFPRGRATTLLAGAGRPIVQVRGSRIVVSGLPAGTGGIRLRLRARGMLATPRVTLRARIESAAASRTLKQRLGKTR